MTKRFKQTTPGINLTEQEAWEIWKACGKLSGVDYYEYATRVILAYLEKNK